MKLKIAFVYIMQIELADIMGGLETNPYKCGNLLVKVFENEGSSFLHRKYKHSC